jgi:hypothetical protein
VLGTAYGLKTLDVKQAMNKQAAQEQPQPKPAPAQGNNAQPKGPAKEAAPIVVPQEDVTDAQIISEIAIISRKCEAEGCLHNLGTNQKKYCSTECRMKSLAKNRKSK